MQRYCFTSLMVLSCIQNTGTHTSSNCCELWLFGLYTLTKHTQRILKIDRTQFVSMATHADKTKHVEHTSIFFCEFFCFCCTIKCTNTVQKKKLLTANCVMECEPRIEVHAKTTISGTHAHQCVAFRPYGSCHLVFVTTVQEGPTSNLKRATQPY